MKLRFTLYRPIFLFPLNVSLFLVVLVIIKSFDRAYGQGGCNPISTLTCDRVQVSLPVNLDFSSSVAGTITDKNGAGTGFTMVDAYSGTRLTQDGTTGNTSVPGYESSKLTLSNGRLQIVTNKGIAFLTNNNQINALGVKIDSRGKLQIETTLINPYNGNSGQQGGLWFGLNDKTFLKLVVTANKVELRREVNDVSSTVTGTTNPDQRITGIITDLNTKTVRLRLVVDPAANTAEGFYSIDGITYQNAGALYTTKSLSISGMGLTTSTAYTGIYATYRNATTPVTYTFEDFSVHQPSAGNTAPVFSPDSYNYSLQDNVALGTVVGEPDATDVNGDVLSYSFISGNTNGAFAMNASTGKITVAKSLNYHTQDSYSLTVRVTDAGGLYDQASVVINVTLGTTVTAFSTIGWGTVASQPFPVYEAQGEVVNGKLYSFSGFDHDKYVQSGYWTPTARAYVYNPVTNTWASIASMPAMNGTNRGGVTHAGFTTDGTDIYFAGGYTSNSTGTGQIMGTKEAWKYIVAENRYVRLPDLPRNVMSGQLEYLKGKLHYVGGFGNSSLTIDIGDHYVLDLDNLATGWKTSAPLPNPRNHPGATVYNGKIYFIGGQHGNDHAAVTQKDVHVYDPDTNSWTKLADLPTPSGTTGRAHISSAVFVLGNRFLVIGGVTSHGVFTNLVSAYSPATNAWQNLTAFPKAIGGGVAGNIGGNIYYTGGWLSKTTYKGVPGATTVQQVASFTLINADTEQPIQTLSNGSTLNLATLPSRNLNIRANTSPSTVGSVVFELSGTLNKTVTESQLPYALFGDNTSSDYYAWTPSVGSYTLKATPYTASRGTGTAGTSLTVNFNVVDQAAITSNPSQSQSISQVSVYPNPSTRENVYIEAKNLDRQKQLTVWLMDMSGRILEIKQMTTDERGNASTILSTSKKLQTGIYILQIQIPSGHIQRRLMVK